VSRSGSGGDHQTTEDFQEEAMTNLALISLFALSIGFAVGILTTGFVSNRELYRANQKGRDAGLKHREELIHQMQRRIDYLENVARRITYQGASHGR
jgi:hypothetical protein